MPDPMQLIRVEGTVQGVGFRPTVWRIAHALGLRGTVQNDGAGVLIALAVADPAEFLARLQEEKPPLARIDRISVTAGQNDVPEDFRIVESAEGAISTAIAADAATCPECLAETLDAAGRRYRYPFTNCTHCGPRLSIVTRLPYDRHNTTMATFAMCPVCRAEYENPADRRYHAQPIACPSCGPTAWFEANGVRIAGDAIELAADWIRLGRIIAVKGLGGFQLACDASDAAAVTALRQRKQRSRKPLALMVPDLAAAHAIAHLGHQEAEMLASPAAPIVLAGCRADAGLAAGIAPGHDTLGLMLPATPLHHLLMQAVARPIVLTSGNLSDDPQVTADDEAISGLHGIVDGFLMHNRPIAQRVDDSVVRLGNDGLVVLRRGRGLAPEPIRLHESFAGAPAVLALGGDLKGAVALGRQGYVTLSQHLGDLATPRSRLAFEETLSLLMGVHAFAPTTIAVDGHPEFHSRREGERRAAESGASLSVVQHHHAHIASCMAENGLPMDHPGVLGIALDGLGLGEDGTIWGGEFLLCSYATFTRLAHFDAVPLPGGDVAARQPWRNAYAHLDAALGWIRVEAEHGGLDAVQFLSAKPLRALAQMIAAGVNVPACSSAGRLLDACAALLGLCRDEQDYEGEAPSLLESLAARSTDTPRSFGVSIDDTVVRWERLFAGILRGLQDGRAAAAIAGDIHETVAHSCAEMAIRLARRHDTTQVALSGGCFANLLLSQSVSARLRAAGLEVLKQHNVPAGDGGLALGQCAIAMARLAEESAQRS